MKKLVKHLFNRGIPVNVNNIVLESLFHVGGTVSDEEAYTYIDKMLSIGFCQPRFYKPSVWKEAKEFMLIMVQYGIVFPCDYGRGKGKFTSKYSNKEIIALLSSRVD